MSCSYWTSEIFPSFSKTTVAILMHAFVSFFVSIFYVWIPFPSLFSYNKQLTPFCIYLCICVAFRRIYPLKANCWTKGDEYFIIYCYIALLKTLWIYILLSVRIWENLFPALFLSFFQTFQFLPTFQVERGLNKKTTTMFSWLLLRLSVCLYLFWHFYFFSNLPVQSLCCFFCGVICVFHVDLEERFTQLMLYLFIASSIFCWSVTIL